MRLRTVAFGTVGLLSAGLGLIVLFFPGLAVSTQTVDLFMWLFQQTDRTRPIVGVAFGIILYILVSSASVGGGIQSRGSTVVEEYETVNENRPESVTAGKRTLTAHELDSEFDAAATEGGHEFRLVRETLVDTAVSVRTSVTNRGEEHSRQAVQRGEWTDDRLAAAFLSGADGPKPSLLSRLRLWLVPVRERRRRIEHSLSAIEEMEP